MEIVQMFIKNRLPICEFAPNDNHIFLYLKKQLAGKNFHDDDEIKI